MDQEEKMYSAHKQIMDRVNTFLEIQNGPNPLSKEELVRLAKKNPRTWSMFLPKE
jgi:hypothetical protein